MMRPFNKLTPAEVERLSLLAEECGEVIQAITKILRHGYESGWKGSNNRDDLAKEIGDVEFATEMLTAAGDVDAVSIINATDEKAEAVARFLHHQPKSLLKKATPHQPKPKPKPKRRRSK